MRKRNTLLLTTMALALVLSVFPMPAAGAYHYIYASPDCGQPGARVYVYGYGFTPNSDIAITWDGDPIATDPEAVVTSESGYFSAYIVVPEAPDGDYTIRATDGEGLYAQCTFRVGPLYLSISPDCGQPGARVQVYGYGFTPNSQITIKWGAVPLDTDPEAVVTSESGYFSAYIVVPEAPDGDYTIRATDGEGLYAQCIFRVGSLYIWFSPSQGPAGARVHVYGYGFTPNSQITTKWEGVPLATDPEVVTTDEAGRFYAYITVPDVGYGDYTVKATDGEGLWAEQTFEVALPYIGFSPWQGPAGGRVQVYASCFTPNSTITIRWEGVPLATDPEVVTTDETGNFNAYITVPDVGYGDYTVKATDGEGLWAERTFEVAPPEIWFSPSQGPAGGRLYVYGSCFTPGSNITITWEGGPIASDPELVVVDDMGNFYANIVVPDVDYGDYTIRATDGEGLWAEQTFEVAPPEIWFYPQGPAGGRLYVYGSCFTPGSNITITWEGGPIASDPELVVVDDMGNFYANIVVPDVDYGDYTIRATDGEGLWAEEVFSVIPPYIEFWPWARGPAGTSVDIHGRAFTPESEISITWDGDPIATDPEVVIPYVDGSFYAHIVVPEVPDGDYTIRATDGEGLWAEEVFTVGPIPTAIWLFPWQGAVNSTVPLIGMGFTPESEITLTCDGEPISFEGVRVDSWGILFAEITVPDVSLGYHIIEATDEEGLSGRALFNVVPCGISVLPGGGSPDDWAFLLGSGFTANSEVTITWDGEPVEAYGETDSRGQLWGDIVVPDVPYGDYTIRATDEEGLWAETVFRVAPSGIVLHPSVGLAGSLVFGCVWDIPQESDITITWDGEPVETSTFLSEVVGLPFPSHVFIVPDVPAGSYTVRATDGEGLWAETTFTVLDIRPAGGGCFIATAAYGTPMAPEIQILREFRDGYLLTNPLGQAFVDFYYRFSPPLAEFITEHPGLKPIVRAGLVPAVAMSTAVVNTTLAQKTAIVLLVALVSVVVAIWATKRRRRDSEYA